MLHNSTTRKQKQHKAHRMSKQSTATSQLINMRVTPDWLKALDDWRSGQMIEPTRSDVIKIAVLQFIERNRKK